MVKKNKKVQSKRMTCSRRYKIQRRVREHIRKSRKEDKGRDKSGLSILKKDPGVPRLHPMKEQILREVEQHKQQMEQQKIARKTSLKRLQAEAKKKNKLFDKSQEQPKYLPIVSHVIKAYTIIRTVKWGGFGPRGLVWPKRLFPNNSC